MTLQPRPSAFRAPAAPARTAAPGGVGPAERRARRLLVALAAGLGLVGAALALLGAGLPRTLLDGAILALAIPLTAYGCVIVAPFALGLVARARGGSALEARALALDPAATGPERTAVAVPIHEEDAVAVALRLGILARSMARAGVSGVDLHVLSDSRDAGTARAEEVAFARLAAELARVPGAPSLAYRRRLTNEGRKVGNLAEFLDRPGSPYDFLIVLDADSVMSGDTVGRLVGLMRADDRLGLVQTVSYAAGRETLFARAQQFASRLYAPINLFGSDAWQGGEGSYWGHNAILRVAAFREHCRLPVLPGRAPLGGEILCHDIVEGALMLRAGYELRVLPTLEGTWEEMPTNPLDWFARDGRWCQGNLQHLGVLGWGLKGASRWHILQGVLAYVACPLWLALLVMLGVRAAIDPALPAGGSALAGALYIGFLTLIHTLPKIISVAAALADPAERARFGGPRRLVASALLEHLHWTLHWPALFVACSRAVFVTLAGRVVPWGAQARSERGLGWGEALAGHKAPLAMGALFLALGLAAGGWHLAWTLPLAASLLLSPATAVLTSRADLGRAARRRGLFLTPDEVAPARELRELWRGEVARHNAGQGDDATLVEVETAARAPVAAAGT